MIAADRFLWLGGGMLIAPYAGLSIHWPAFARVPRSALTPERLAWFVFENLVTEKDDGYPYGPRRRDLISAWQSSCLFNHPSCAKRIWQLLHESRCNLPYCLPLKTRPEEWEGLPGVKALNGYEVISELAGNLGAVPVLSLPITITAPRELTAAEERAQAQAVVQASFDEHKADLAAGQRVRDALKNAGIQLTS